MLSPWSFLLRALRRGSHMLFLGVRGSEDGLTPREPQPSFSSSSPPLATPSPSSSSSACFSVPGGVGGGRPCVGPPPSLLYPRVPAWQPREQRQDCVAVGPLLMAPGDLEGAPGGLRSLFSQDVQGPSSPQPRFQRVGVACRQADPHSACLTGQL